MKLQLFNFVCDPEGHKFLAPGRASDPELHKYRGEGTGEMRMLDPINNPHFREVIDMVDNLIEGPHEDPGATRLRAQVFGIVACDQDGAGQPFSGLAKPKCPQCGTTKMNAWGPTNPPQFVEKDVPFLTHEKWTSLTQEAKLAAVRDTVACLRPDLVR